MGILYDDNECVYLGDDPRIDDEQFGAIATVQLTADDLTLQLPQSGVRHSYPRSKIKACQTANIEWEEYVSDDMKLKKSRHAIVCQFKSGPPERNDEPPVPDDLVLQIGFRNKQFAKTFETRLRENTPLYER